MAAGDETALLHEKALRRRELRDACRALPAEARAAQSARCCALLAAAVSAAGDPPLAAYMALAWELDLDALLTARWAQDRSVWLPRVLGPGRLGWVAISNARQLAPGAHGIREPHPNLPTALAPPPGCLLLAPGVGFTRDGRRLGQGGGYYDRALPLLRPTLAAVWGVGLDPQLCDELPLADHDVRVDRVVARGRWWPDPPPAALSPSVACRIVRP